MTEIRENQTAIPAPEPAGMGPEYENLWHRAWKLANEIDNPGGAPLAERKAKLPELDRLRARMAEIERQAVPTAGPEPQTSPRGGKGFPPPVLVPTAGPEPQTSPAETCHTWEAIDTTTRGRTPENCPARCKKTGKCHALAYFEGKPGRAAECDVSQCSRAKDYKS